MERWIMIHNAQGWQLAVERGPGWLFVRPYSLDPTDDGLTQPDDGLALQGIGLAGEATETTGDTLLETSEAESGLAEQVWHLLEQNFTRRVVLELDQLGSLTTQLVGQLVALQERVVGEGGLVRICGLSPANQAVLEHCGLLGRFVCYDTRPDAVMGYRPPQPR
jgi:anti-anti-sigma regulatory factor